MVFALWNGGLVIRSIHSGVLADAVTADGRLLVRVVADLLLAHGLRAGRRCELPVRVGGRVFPRAKGFYLAAHCVDVYW